jgi:GldM C-terminal domain
MKKLVLIFSLINAFVLGLSAQDAVISVERMNVFYLGIDNLIAIAVPNVSSDNIKVSIDNQATIQKNSAGNYTVRVTRVGEAVITVEANGQITKKKFRIKQMPDPTPSVGGFKDGLIALAKFQSASGVVALINFSDIDGQCAVQSYTIAISSKKGEAYLETIAGSAFSYNAVKRIQSLEIGDIVKVFEIKIRCPGDVPSRNLGSLTYIMQ